MTSPSVGKIPPVPDVTPIETGESVTFVDKVLATPAVRRFANEMNVSDSLLLRSTRHVQGLDTYLIIIHSEDHSWITAVVLF